MPFKSRSLLLLLPALAACSTAPAGNDQANVDTDTGALAKPADAQSAGTANDVGNAATAGNASSSASASILQSSTPADGAEVAGPVDQLSLRFAVPARLLEMTVTGPDGSVMPSMITAAGEMHDYSVPLSVTDPGSYRVDWRASAGGAERKGSIRFTLR